MRCEQRPGCGTKLPKTAQNNHSLKTDDSWDGPYFLPTLCLKLTKEQEAQLLPSAVPLLHWKAAAKWPLRAGLALAAPWWPSPDCPLWSLLYAVYILVFLNSWFYMQLLWHSLRPALCKAGILDPLCRDLFCVSRSFRTDAGCLSICSTPSLGGGCCAQHTTFC